MAEASDSKTLYTQRQRLAQLARQAPQMGFTSLNHLLTTEALAEAYTQLRRAAAPGIDGQSVNDYGAKLSENLVSLVERAKSGSYRATPVKRVRIPKPGAAGETRPLGLPVVEDKVLQRAVATILELIYEQDFLPCSYGFRRGRSAHQALEDLRRQALQTPWIVEVDIRRCFDTLDHAHLRSLLAKRMRDGVLMRLIGKWLNAGVLEGGTLTHPEAGVPQGGNVSPMLCNVYLHYVLDVWFEREIKPRLSGRAFLIRYADDFVLGFTNPRDAQRFLTLLTERFAAFGLTLHPEKTRLLEFRPPVVQSTGAPEATGNASFSFLGFTHFWAKSRKGQWTIKYKTAADRLRRAIVAAWTWCRKHLHWPLPEQHKMLSQKLRGYDNYFGRTGNYPSLAKYHRAVRRCWRYWLSRSSWAVRHGGANLDRWMELYPLPPPRIVHSVFRAQANP